MHSGTLPTLRVELLPSRSWGACIGIVHAAGFAMFAASGAPASVVVGTAVIVAAHAVFRIRRDALLATPRAIVALELATGQMCTFVARDGSRMTGRVGAATRVTGRLVVVAVHARPWRGSRTIAIAPGMAEAGAVRAMRVRLRWDTAPLA